VVTSTLIVEWRRQSTMINMVTGVVDPDSGSISS
jgi:hypothetical protein